MESAEIATTIVEMGADMDAQNGDVTDAKTTDEMTRWKDAEIPETDTWVPTMT